MIGILGEYYPETLAMSYMQEVPFVIRTLINIMWPFIDPNTKKKIKIIYGSPRAVVDGGDLMGERLLKECGGDLDVSVGCANPCLQSILETGKGRMSYRKEAETSCLMIIRLIGLLSWSGVKWSALSNSRRGGA